MPMTLAIQRWISLDTFVTDKTFNYLPTKAEGDRLQGYGYELM